MRHLRRAGCPKRPIRGPTPLVVFSRAAKVFRLTHSNSTAELLNVPLMLRLGARWLYYEFDFTRFTVEQHSVTQNDFLPCLVPKSHHL